MISTTNTEDSDDGEEEEDNDDDDNKSKDDDYEYACHENTMSAYHLNVGMKVQRHAPYPW